MTTSPMAPASIKLRACSTAGKKRVHTPSCNITLLRSAAAYISWASSTLFARAFSQSTCLPASIAFRLCSLCNLSGVPMYTMSTSGEASMFSKLPYALSTPCAFANARALSSDREATAAMAAPAHSRDERTNWREISPVPTIPQRKGKATSSARVRPRPTSLGVKDGPEMGGVFFFLDGLLLTRRLVLFWFNTPGKRPLSQGLAKRNFKGMCNRSRQALGE